MLHALGRRTSPRAPSSTPTGRAHVRCKVAHNALLAPEEYTGGTSHGEACISKSSRAALQPVCPKPSAGRITPTKLAGLSELLRLPITRVELLLQSSPVAVQQMEPQQVAQRLQDLCRALDVRPKQAAFMISKQPAYMLLTPMDDIHSKVLELGEALEVPPTAVLRTALTVPSILRRKSATVQRRVEAYCALLGCSPLDVLHIMARGPEYLSDTPSSVRQRMIALGYVLRRPRCTIAAMLQARPDLVSISSKVMNSKVNGLMCILNKQKRHVVTLLVKVPALLRCDLDRARHAFEGLQVLLQKAEGFVYAMICHAPNLLLMSPRGMHQRCAALRRCLSASPDWQEEFQRLRPPEVAQLLLNRWGCLSALMYLADRRRAGTVPLACLLAKGPGNGPAQVLGASWPDFLAWMQRRRQYVAMRAQQRRAALLGTEIARPSMPAAGPAAQRSGAAPAPGLVPTSTPVYQQQQPMCPASMPAATISAAVIASANPTLRHAGRVDHAPPQQQNADTRPLVVQRAAGDVVCEAGESGHSAASDSASCSAEGSTRTSIGLGCESTSTGGSRDSVSDMLQEAVDAAGAADRRQQAGASTSGRQPSWLQLQADYWRGLQGRSQKVSLPVSERSGPAKGAKTAVGALPAPGNRARRRRKAAHVAAADALRVGGSPAAGLAQYTGASPPLSSSLKGPPQRPVEAAVQAVGPVVVSASAPSVALASVQLQEGRAGAVCGGSASVTSDGEPPGVFVVDAAGGDASSFRAALGPGLVWTEQGLAEASGGDGRHGQTRQPQRHVLSSLMLPGRKQQQQSCGVSQGMSRAVNMSDGLVSSQGAAHALTHGQVEAPLLDQRPKTSRDMGRAGQVTSGGNDACQADAEGPAGGTEDLGEVPASQAFVGARPMPVWLQANGAARGDAAGGMDSCGEGGGGSSSSDGDMPASGHGLSHLAETPQLVHFADTDGREFGRHTGAGSQADSNGSLVVVSGDGALCDIAGVGREPHDRGRQGQRRSAIQQGHIPGQTQVLETALGVPSPR